MELQESLELVELVISCARTRLEACGEIRGGSLGRGTACSGSVDAEVLLLLKGLGERARWLPRVLETVREAVVEEVKGAEAVVGASGRLEAFLAEVQGDAVQVCLPGGLKSHYTYNKCRCMLGHDGVYIIYIYIIHM